jgi:probable blue pigment (indigoidine) exporter
VGAALWQGALRARGARLTRADLRAAAPGGLGFGLSVAFLFVAYQTTTLVSANVISCLEPLVLGVVAHRTAGRLGGSRWAATAVATAGTVVVVVGSSAHAGDWSLRGDLFALAATAANVAYVLGTKRARAHMGSVTYQAAMLWVAAAALLPVVAVTDPGQLVPPVAGWWAIAGVALVGGAGHVLFASAQRHVTVAASSALGLAEVVAAAAGAAVLFGQSLGPVQLAGMALVAAAIVAWVRLPDAPPTRRPRTRRRWRTATRPC